MFKKMSKKGKSKINLQDKASESGEEVLELKHARRVICDRLDRFRHFLDVRHDEIFQIEIRLKSVEEDFSEFDKIQTRLEYLSDSEEEYRLDTESSFYSLIALAKEIIANQRKKEKNDSLAGNFAASQGAGIGAPPLTRASAVAKLPDLGLPSFNGKFETWYSFKDIFDSVVHNRNDLSEIDKFLYLKICCKADALKLIDSLDVTSANYSIALDLLKKRFENKRAIINYHINNLLFNLPQISRESAPQLTILLDSLHHHI